MTASVAGAPDAEAMLAAARDRIARELLDAHPARLTVGEITLHPHQVRAVSRLKALLRLDGGALLADATGLGKTFVALAIAAEFEQTLIITPAALLDAWRRSAGRAGMAPLVTSMERLSRGTAPVGGAYDLIVIDEAHHFRNPHTRRYAAAASLCDRARVLLLSATPLQNRRDDLVAQLALFLGDAALNASDAELARFIVRRRVGDTKLVLPDVNGPYRVELPPSDDLLDDLIALPAPVPGSDEGEAAALISYSLLRQWASSRAALVGALRRRLAKATALLSSLEAGRWPTRDELHVWSCGTDAMQLAMPELLATPRDAPREQIASLLAAVRSHTDGLRALLSRLRTTPNPDIARAEALARIAAAHPERRVIAFSQYAESVRELSRLLMPRRAGVAELTARGGRIAGGRIGRREVLAQFAPGAGAGAAARVRDRITMLITTDVLSEGLDLQEASVVVHLDLPWNPARLEQRVGRVRRLGSRQEQVHVYVFAPPASSERVLGVERRLLAKLRIAANTIGLGLPATARAISGATLASTAPPELTSDVFQIVERWRDACLPVGVRDYSSPVVAGVAAPNDGVLALLTVRGEPVLLAAEGGEASTDPTVVASSVRLCSGAAVVVSGAERAWAIGLVETWCEAWGSRRRLALGSSSGVRVRARIAARIAELLSSASRHQYSVLAALASRARRSLRTRLGAAGERALGELAERPVSDAGWLEDVAALAEHRIIRREDEDARLLVVIVLRSDPNGRRRLESDQQQTGLRPHADHELPA